jgi:hypothetical protein
MKALRTAKRFLGFMLYFFMALPLTLGGLSLAAVRPWLTNPDSYVELVRDARFSALLEAPELRENAPAAINVGDYALEGPAAVAALQAALPSAAIVDTAESAIAGFFRAIDGGAASYALDLSGIKAAAERGSPVFVSTYFSAASNPLGGLPAGTLPQSLAGSNALDTERGRALALDEATKLVRARVAELPASVNVPLEPEGADIGWNGRPMNLIALQTGLAASSLWLLLAGGGLCVASAFIAEDSWRKRLARLGGNVLGPGIFVLVIGLVPHLINPAGLIRGGELQGFNLNQIPALTEYVKFAATRLTGGFLSAGLAAVALGTVFSSAKFVIPARDDEEELEIEG